MASTNTDAQRGETLRTQGNALYREVSSGGRGDTSSKRGKLSRAQKSYDEALKLSSSSEERASCCKNLGALHSLWGKVELELVPSWIGGGPSEAAATLSACKEHLTLSVTFFMKAKLEGARAKKPKEWLDHVDASLLRMVNWVADQSMILAFPGAPILRGLCEDFDRLTSKGNLKSEAGALANVELAKSLFDQAKLNSQEGAELRTICKEPLQRASHLLEGLPTTTSTKNLSKRISDIQSELHVRLMFAGFQNVVIAN